MTLERALLYARYNRECPPDVSPERWRAILRYIEKNYA